MGAPRTGFRRGLDDLYDYLDTEIPSHLPRSHDLIWVGNAHNGVDSVNNGSFDAPLATLDYAIGRASANKGSTILVKEGHSETIIGAGGIAVDVANVRIIGLGEGRQRPRFLMDGGTSVTAVISAANAMLSNLRFAGGHSDIVAGIDVQAAGAILDSLEFLQNTTDENFLTPIKSTLTVDETAAGLQVKNCYMYQLDASTVEFLELNADVTGLIFHNNIMISEGTNSPAILCATGKDLKGCSVQWNFLSAKGANSTNLFISNDTASPNNSGIIAHNRCRHADATGAHTMGAVGGCGFFDNLSASTDAVSGFVLPAIDVDL